jgi:hypothetical protein
MPVKDRSTGPEVNLRLVRPQWQGGGTVSVQQLASEFPLDIGRRGYAVGSAVLEAVLPPHDGPTASVPVTFSPEELRGSSGPLLEWLATTGCSRVAIHFDVDTIDSNEIVLGLGAELTA